MDAAGCHAWSPAFGPSARAARSTSAASTSLCGADRGGQGKASRVGQQGRGGAPSTRAIFGAAPHHTQHTTPHHTTPHEHTNTTATSTSRVRPALTAHHQLGRRAARLSGPARAGRGRGRKGSGGVPASREVHGRLLLRLLRHLLRLVGVLQLGRGGGGGAGGGGCGRRLRRQLAGEGGGLRRDRTGSWWVRAVPAMCVRPYGRSQLAGDCPNHPTAPYRFQPLLTASYTRLTHEAQGAVQCASMRLWTAAAAAAAAARPNGRRRRPSSAACRDGAAAVPKARRHRRRRRRAAGGAALIATVAAGSWHWAGLAGGKHP
jgi:hypothetical protein